MTKLTLFEHEAQPFDWDDRDLAALEKMNRSLGVDILVPAVSGRERLMRASAHVGIVRLSGRTIEILPKLYRGQEDRRAAAAEATHNLLHLVAMAGGFSVREHSVAPLLSRVSDWFEILTHLFTTHLMEEWQRGPAKSYQVVDEDLSMLKGKWRLPDQLRRPAQPQVLAVSYDEFTADNDLNRVLRYVVQRLFLLTRDPANRHTLEVLRRWMDGVTLLRCVTISDVERVQLNRLNRRFEPVLNLARLFLDGSALQLSAGDVDTFAFVFDMNALFEAFVVNTIRRNRDEILPPALASCELLPQSMSAIRYLAHDEYHPVFHLKPDLAFRQGGAFPLLLDAKYKLLDITAPSLNISQPDLYQMYAYANRFECPCLLMVYPTALGTSTGRRRLHWLDSKEPAGVPASFVYIGALDIRVPLYEAVGRQCIKDQLYSLLGAMT
jgi:5-methylcytosine-specific restriction enzyme subunit McrC